MPLMLKIVLGFGWLIAAYLVQSNDTGRRILAYLACVLAFLHVGALLGGVLEDRIRSDPQVISLIGFTVGGILGVLTGIITGRYAVNVLWFYWVVQIVTVGFLVFLPLYPY